MFLDKINFWQRRKPQALARQVFVNEPLPKSKLDAKGRPVQKYVTNKVKTSKYSILTFIPKNLYEQFRRVANFFFFALVILQWLPEFATINPVVSALPMFIIISITAIKDGFEDWKRHVTDKTLNNRKTWTLRNWQNYNYADFHSLSTIQRIKSFLTRESIQRPDQKGEPEWQETLWKDVRVGDFIKLKNDDFIPADVLILSTSEPNSLCYVETKNLDGETNLKIRQTVPETDHLNTPKDCASIKFYVDSEPPTTNLFSYNATLVFPEGLPGRPRPRSGAIRVPINLNAMLLRGCVLKNTEWVIGVVVFTGTDTKLALNSGKTPSKRSRIEKQMNPQIGINLALMVILCVLCAIGTRIWEAIYVNRDSPFLNQKGTSTDKPGFNAFIAFWNAMVTFQNIVPISLYLSIEFIKSVQAFFIYMDDEMRYKKTDTPCIPKNWNLSDDLGQIEYIFSDKTGTLTQNVMEFRRCSIAGKIYHGTIPETQKIDIDIAEPKNNSKILDPLKNSSTLSSSAEPDKLPFTDVELLNDMNNPNDLKHAEAIKNFWILLAVCHTVLVSTTPEGEQNYKAQSPDEAALVKAAKDIGFTFRSRESNTIFITDPEGREIQYELLNILEFTSARKRMSIILKSPEDGTITLFCKGADNVIFERLRTGQDYMLNTTGEHLEEFAKEGLRTLCLAKKTIDVKEYEKWNIEYREASTSITEREKRVETVCNQIEQNLTLLGATAIEDRLQDGVPECIATLKRAGIKIWVLTGDKMETAISIGFSTCLLSKEMSLIVIRGGAYGESGSAYEQMRNAVEKFFGTDPEIQQKIQSTEVPPVNQLKNAPSTSTSHTREMSTGSVYSMMSGVSTTPRAGGHALIIDGVALKHALEEPWSRDLLLDLACRCKGVICCRVSPLQKAKVVELVKQGKSVLTCAIGDGANDVSMIQAAHVGIGVAGEEGLQAVMASDYAIAQFRYLTRLLLVHGHYAYVRNTSMILNFFYKNLIGVAVLAIGVFDRDFSDRVAIEIPELYQWGILQKAFSMFRFFIYMAEGLYQSLVCFFVPYFAYQRGTVNHKGREPDILEMGTTMAVACIMLANLFVGFNMQCWTVLHFVTVFGSIALIYIYIAIYALLPISEIYGYEEAIYGNAVFWLCLLLTVVLSLLPRYLVRYTQRLLRPHDIDIVQEICKQDPNHDFIHDPNFMPPYATNLRRQRTCDSKHTTSESVKPLYNDRELSQSPRTSFATDRTMSMSILHDSASNIPPAPLIPMEYIAVSNDTIEGTASMTNMRTGITTSMRGYAFSQEEGAGQMIMPSLRRRKTNPGPLGRVSSMDYESGSLRRLSLPDVRSARDVLDILGGNIPVIEGDENVTERIRMVHFTDVTREDSFDSSIISENGVADFSSNNNSMNTDSDIQEKKKLEAEATLIILVLNTSLS
ncbi:11543_t:CDS:10 [Ambispora leptoticha]|uniref:Phospholipid-transporting ATPase n=1 Tax=Ambispora leptoticha TaxID=144679 RepID=A0A9N8ZLY0_9GLOM|nr:11543_t:CDS:10 [Ambispora leptoticha]